MNMRVGMESVALNSPCKVKLLFLESGSGWKQLRLAGCLIAVR